MLCKDLLLNMIDMISTLYKLLNYNIILRQHFGN